MQPSSTTSTSAATAGPSRSGEGAFASADGTALFRRWVVPTGSQTTLARLAVVPGYGEHCQRYDRFMRWTAQRGVACHGMDFRGHGRSDGRRGYVARWEAFLEDLRAFFALDDLRPGDGRPPLFVLGHSHGGLVVARAVIDGTIGGGDLAGGVLTSPFFANAVRVPAWKHWLARALDPVCPWALLRSGLSQEMMSSDPELVAESRADPLMLRCATPRFYLRMLASQAEAMDRAGEFRLPLLTLAGGADPLSSLEAIRTFHERAGSRDKTIRVYPGLRHELLREALREAVFADILGWITARLRS
jgi:lysophospholipase